jgi:outer membrane protein OmpA-like peptidoglycan-associated protein
MHNRLSLVSVLPLLVLPLFAAAQPGPPTGAEQTIDLSYVGAATRLGIGYDTRNKLRGEAYQVFGESDRAAWIGELWLSDRSAAGAQLSYHWQPDGGGDAAVRKLFGAVDQNRWHDRKVTAGGGLETEGWFAAGYASAAATGRRQISVREAMTTETITGSENGRQFEQDIFTTIRTQISERAYDYGVGTRAGRFYEAPLLRLQLGFDYEWGRGSASQSTLSLALEKFFAGTPHSVALVVEAYHKSGALEPERNDGRLTVMYRYEFGRPAYRPAREYRMVKVETPAVSPAPVPAAQPPAPAAPRVEKRLVKTTASMASDAFFDFDRSTLRPDATGALDSAIARLKASGYEGNIRITGHTCNIGTAAYNQRLSERRAQAVRRYLIAGGLPADRLWAEGMGLRDPRYPNTREGRPKNRRVDIEFVTYETRSEDVVLPPEPAPAAPTAVAPVPMQPTIEWRREYIESEPSWLRRALHNPAQHKQTVDVYRLQQTSTTVTQGDKRFINRPPVAVNDAFAVTGNSTNNALDVLPNDSDPDGDVLTIVAVGTPAHGSASIAAGKISYTPTVGYVGTDAFTYTIADPRGLTSSATVSITVTAINHPPSAQPDLAVAKFNTPVTIAVLANDSDPDGDPLTIVSFTAANFGVVTRGPNNTLIYTANQNFIGMDGFQYTISDGRGGIASTTVTVYADP